MSPRLQIDEMVVEHRTRRGVVHAVAGVSLELAAGETLGLVGESGCGKSSLARAIVGLNTPKSGAIRIDGRATDPSRRGAQARDIQMVFQDPYGSLNPRMSVRELVEEPLSVHRLGNRSPSAPQGPRRCWSASASRLAMHDRLPHQLSGGQRQRVGIARAMALEPKIVICDEPVSALDVSVQAQVLNLLLDLQREQELTFLFISHDLEVVRYVSHRIAVMYLGVIVEIGPAEGVWSLPLHPYTRALMQTAGDAERVAATGPMVTLVSELPNPLHPPSGCRFRTRCPLAIEVCARDVPALEDFGDGHRVACHRAGEWASTATPVHA
jgi:oligopeptide/dipeptide ABC transporter ATP-binding protein